MSKLLTTKDVSDRLGVTMPRVHALIQAGRLPAEKFGRDYVIKESDLALVSERKAGRPKKNADTDVAAKPVASKKLSKTGKSK
jgi:excisionase family DNA binding protein